MQPHTGIAKMKGTNWTKRNKWIGLSATLVLGIVGCGSTEIDPSATGRLTADALSSLRKASKKTIRHSCEDAAGKTKEYKGKVYPWDVKRVHELEIMLESSKSSTIEATLSYKTVQLEDEEQEAQELASQASMSQPLLQATIWGGKHDDPTKYADQPVQTVILERGDTETLQAGRKDAFERSAPFSDHFLYLHIVPLSQPEVFSADFQVSITCVSN